MICKNAKPQVKTLSNAETDACLGKDDAVAKDKDLLRDHEYLADGALWKAQDTSTNSTQSDKIVFKQIGIGSDFSSRQIFRYLTTKIKARFRERLARIISCLFSLVKAQPYDNDAKTGVDAPLYPSSWFAYSKLEVDQVLQIQGVLGNAEITIDDLLKLPRQPENPLRGWLVQIDIVTGAIKSRQNPEATVEAEVAEVGVYTGSATGMGGGIQRWLHYDRIIPSCILKERIF